MKNLDTQDREKGSYLISAGIDIGTTTTQFVFSQLEIEEKRGYGLIPQVSIASKKAIYKSPIYETPLIDKDQIDAKGIKELTMKAYVAAGLSKSQVDTGAIIITGETAQKRNAKKVIEEIADYVGHFIAYAAGGHLESVLAGKGSGAQKLSEETGRVVANFDIGGGTTNIACFQAGELKGTACLLLGAKCIRVKNNRIISIAPHIERLLKKSKLHLLVGDLVDEENTQKVLDQLAKKLISILGSLIHLEKKEEALENLLLGEINGEMQMPAYISFSGGVADCIWCEEEDFKYEDLGIILGKALRESKLMNFGDQNEKGTNRETIGATVVGASQYAVSLSGATIYSNRFSFPSSNIPVISLYDKASNILQINSDKEINRAKDLVYAIYVESPDYMNYIALEKLTDQLIDFVRRQDASLGVADSKSPFVCVFKADIAKAVGQMLKRKMGSDRAFLSIDGLTCQNGDVIDIGKAIKNGTNIPVIIKTLVFDND